MTQTFLPTDALDGGIESMFPSAAITRTATATNGTSTLTFSVPDAATILVGMTVTGAGITSGGAVSAVNNATGVVTLTGTITTLTASAYVFTLTLQGTLHTASPGFTGANEVVGGSYAEQSATFGAPATGSKATTNAQNWTSMPAVTVTHFGFKTPNGTWRGGGPLTSSLTVPAGATVAAAIGALTLGQSG